MVTIGQKAWFSLVLWSNSSQNATRCSGPSAWLLVKHHVQDKSLKLLTRSFSALSNILHWSMHSLPLSKDCKREKWNCACALSRQSLETHNPISIETSGLGGELAFACFLFPEGFSVAYIISKMKEVIKIVVLKKVKRCLNTNKIKG